MWSIHWRRPLTSHLLTTCWKHHNYIWFHEHMTCTVTQDPTFIYKGPELGLTLCCCRLEISNNFIFKLCFVNEVWRNNGVSTWAEKVLAIGVSTFLAAQMQIAFKYPRNTEFLLDPQYVWVCKTQREYRVNILHQWLTALRSHAFHLNQNWL